MAQDSALTLKGWIEFVAVLFIPAIVLELLLTLHLPGPLSTVAALALYLIPLFQAALVHEFGHLIFAKRRGLNARIRLPGLSDFRAFPFVPVLKTELGGREITRKEDRVITVAGPLFNLLFMIVYLLLVLSTMRISFVLMTIFNLAFFIYNLGELLSGIFSK